MVEPNCIFPQIDNQDIRYGEAEKGTFALKVLQRFVYRRSRLRRLLYLVFPALPAIRSLNVEDERRVGPNIAGPDS